MGLIGVSRTVALFGAGQPVITIDEGFAAFSEARQSMETNRLLLLPPAGTCTSYTALYHVDVGEFESAATALANPGEAHTLDAGVSLTISAAGDSRIVPHTGVRPGVYWTRLGFEDPSLQRNLPLFLNHPPYRVSISGGRDVPAFSGTLPGVAALDWINRDALTTIQRLHGATFEWRGVPSDALVLILASSFDSVSTAGEICYCAANASEGRMDVPGEMLAPFPATGSVPGPMRSGAALIAIRLQEENPVPGADVRLVSVFVAARKTDYR